MSNPNPLTLDVDRIRIREWLRKSNHPSVRATKLFYVYELLRRFILVLFFWGPAMAIFMPVGFIMLDHISGRAPLENLVEHMGVVGIDASLNRAIDLVVAFYIVGVFMGSLFMILSRLYTPLDEAVEFYMAKCICFCKVQKETDNDGATKS